ncbi:MAG: DUF1223 domain-containing protein [Planctomycetota bacterium]
MTRLIGAAACSIAMLAPAANAETEPFALVELFTSEGCHSCPPADEVASELIERTEQDGRRVFVLAWHVDYWDYLGWEDRFSDAAYSDWQRSYARAFRTPQIYTPQMVVNGTNAFVGSRRAQAVEAVESGLAQQASADLSYSINGAVEPGETLRVGFDLKINGTIEGPSLVHVVITESDIQTDVTRGENAGKTLHHDGVVRAHATGEPGTLTGDIEIAIPSDVEIDNASVVVFVQDRKTMRVLAAEGGALAE